MTPFQYQTLQLISGQPGIRARELAQLLWPLNKMHDKTLNNRSGAQRGKGAWLCAGSYVSRLIKKGLVIRRRDPIGQTGYLLTNKGLAQLKAHKAFLKTKG